MTASDIRQKSQKQWCFHFPLNLYNFQLIFGWQLEGCISDCRQGKKLFSLWEWATKLNSKNKTKKWPKAANTPSTDISNHHKNVKWSNTLNIKFGLSFWSWRCPLAHKGSLISPKWMSFLKNFPGGGVGSKAVRKFSKKSSIFNIQGDQVFQENLNE